MSLILKLKCLLGRHLPKSSLFVPCDGKYVVIVECAHCDKDLTDSHPEQVQKLVNIAESVLAVKNDGN